MTGTETNTGVIWLSELQGASGAVQEAAGGKARGLAQLVSWGLRVPDSAVILSAGDWLRRMSPSGDDSEALSVLQSVLERLSSRAGPGKVAVRSSGVAEDGAHASFAGQYLSLLGLETPESVLEAIRKCVAAAHSQALDAYEQAMGGQGGSLSLVIQRQVEAQKAGALFTVDPVSGRHEVVVIDAVRGLGDQLMAGHITPEHRELTREGKLQAHILPPDGAVLADDDVTTLLSEALAAEGKAGHPLDMEWAIDGQGQLYWLQARPITALAEEQDEVEPGDMEVSANTLLTTYNVGEILPGAVTPLTWSYISDALDRGLTGMLEVSGVPREAFTMSMVPRYHGHLFLNMEMLGLTSAYVAGTSKEELDFALAGHRMPGEEPTSRVGTLTRVLNLFRYVRMMVTAHKLVPELEARVPQGWPTLATTLSALFQQAEEYGALAAYAAGVHVKTSGTSSVTHTLILRTLSNGQRPEVHHHGIAAGLLTNFDQVESADVLKQLERLAKDAARDVALRERLLQGSAQDCLNFIRGPESGGFAQRFESFLRQHGHRGIREAELRARDWAEDPTLLVELLRSQLRQPQGAPTGMQAAKSDPWASIGNPLTRAFLRKAVEWARVAVRNRERTKSLTVLPIRQTRRILLKLAELLVAEGRIPDADLLFFFTRQELPLLISAPQPALIQKALRRRRKLAQQVGLQMPRYCLGRPVPVEPTDETSHSLEMSGLPVSLGRVEGLARVARTQEEASQIQAGEILIVQYTDIGWTPYFALAAGVATEIGSPLSHGAVVAREYGIPAVCNLPGATRRFKTGDKVRLDGGKGTLVRLDG